MRQLIKDRNHTYSMFLLVDFIPVKTIFLKLKKTLTNTEIPLNAQLESICWYNTTASIPFLSGTEAHTGYLVGYKRHICERGSGCSVTTEVATSYCNISASWVRKTTTDAAGTTRTSSNDSSSAIALPGLLQEHSSCLKKTLVVCHSSKLPYSFLMILKYFALSST